jgi:hypothetical protein
MVLPIAIIVAALLAGVGVAQDTLGLRSGYKSIATKNFNVKFVEDTQVLASLTPAGDAFDFLPFDYISRRARNGQYHWGDITIRYRPDGSPRWTSVDSAANRRPATKIPATSAGVISASSMNPTLPNDIPLAVTREWIDVSGDLGLNFTLVNTGTKVVEVGSLGFPTEFNSIFVDRTAVDMQAKCSLVDPYIGLHAGYLRVSRLSGNGSALVVTPLGDTPFEAYRNLRETSYRDMPYGEQVFEGLYEWQVLTKAWAESEWSGKLPWNTPSSKILQPGQSISFGLRFSVAKAGIRGIEKAVRSTGTPVAVGVPGYIIPRDMAARLFLQSSAEVSSTTSDPVNSLLVMELQPKVYSIKPTETAWGRAKLTIKYADGKVQTVHYYLIKPAPEAISNLGTFLTTAQWYNDTSDPFGRAHSVLTYDYETKSIVLQDERVWVAGLSDEGGAGSFLAAMMKQAAQPNADEISKLERFVSQVLYASLQNFGSEVRKSLFFYEPASVPGYEYNSTMNWSTWTSWNKASAYKIDRAYNYVHVAASYWALYRAGRAYPNLLREHTWDWYLTQAYSTIMRSMRPPVGYSDMGLMGETVFGEVLEDLKREGKITEMNDLTNAMRTRARRWDSQPVPFGSEMSWDSTGQEGVYYWSKYVH